MLIYYIFLIFLILLFLFFVYNLPLDISYQNETLKISLFYFPIGKFTKEQLLIYLKKHFPQSKNQMKKHLDYSLLCSLIIFKRLDIIVSYSLDDFVLIYYLSYLIWFVEDLSLKNLSSYRIKFVKSDKLKVEMKTRICFNVGIILWNMILIKWRYKNG
jgi:hypothetical protein